MYWLGLWKSQDEDWRTRWNYSFRWTPDHLSSDLRHRLKHTYDKLADECLDCLDLISPPGAELPRNSSRASKDAKDGSADKSPAKRDLYELLRANATGNDTLGRLWSEVNTVPEWVDWQQIERGQEVFYRYGGAALTGLAYQSLLGGMV